MTDKGFLDWAFKQKYDNEKELLRAMLHHTESWYNEIMTPLKGLLYAISWGKDLDADKYAEIARELYFKKIEVNHGNYLRNTMEQMSEEGIMLFASRYKLQRRTQEFLDSGNFLKDIVNWFGNWYDLRPETQYYCKQEVRKGWENFKVCKEQLVTEINRQIRRLDAPLDKAIRERTVEGSVISILFLSADPTNASRLRLGEELREIQEKLQLAKLRDRFELHQRMSVRPVDISQALLDVQPQIVHFSGHGTATGALCFEEQIGKVHPIQPDALAALFEQFANQVNCVLLNACYTETQAGAIAKHIQYVIGMNQSIGDKAAIAFAVGFYQALGAGRTIEDAYKLGRVQIRLQGIPEHLTPVLIIKEQAQP